MLPCILVKCHSCSSHQIAFHRRLSDCQTWISIFKRTQSGYKSADLPVFTYLAQKFASALNLRLSSQTPLAASLFSSKISNIYIPSKTWYHQHSASFGELHSLNGSSVQPTKMVARCKSWLLTLSLTVIDSKLPCYNNFINCFLALDLLRVPQDLFMTHCGTEQ